MLLGIQVTREGMGKALGGVINGEGEGYNLGSTEATGSVREKDSVEKVVSS